MNLKETSEIGIQTELHNNNFTLNCDNKSYVASNISNSGTKVFRVPSVENTSTAPTHIDNQYQIRDNLVANFNAFAVGLKQLGLAHSDGSLPLNNSINSQNCSASQFGNLSNVKNNPNTDNNSYMFHCNNGRNITMNNNSMMNESVQTLSNHNQNSLNASAEKNCRTKSLENQNRVNSDSLRYKSQAHNIQLFYDNCTAESKSIGIDTNDKTDEENVFENTKLSNIKDIYTDTCDLSDFCKSKSERQSVAEKNPCSETNDSPDKNAITTSKTNNKNATEITLASENNINLDTWRKPDSIDKHESIANFQSSNDDFKKNSPYFKYLNDSQHNSINNLVSNRDTIEIPLNSLNSNYQYPENIIKQDPNFVSINYDTHDPNHGTLVEKENVVSIKQREESTEANPYFPAPQYDFNKNNNFSLFGQDLSKIRINSPLIITSDDKGEIKEGEPDSTYIRNTQITNNNSSVIQTLEHTLTSKNDERHFDLSKDSTGKVTLHYTQGYSENQYQNENGSSYKETPQEQFALGLQAGNPEKFTSFNINKDVLNKSDRLNSNNSNFDYFKSINNDYQSNTLSSINRNASCDNRLPNYYLDQQKVNSEKNFESSKVSSTIPSEYIDIKKFLQIQKVEREKNQTCAQV